MSNNISLLYPPIQEMANLVLDKCNKLGLNIYISSTVRSVDDQVKIYGKERWTLHYIGIAVDFQPHLKCKLHEWEHKFNNWPNWNKLQCDIAVKCGFDTPQKWQMERDRPHCQKLFGISEGVLKSMWYASGGNIKEIWRYIDLHQGKNNG